MTENTDKKNNLKYKLSKDLVWCLHWKIIHLEEAISKIIGYTRAIVTSNSSNKRRIFYSHPYYQGEEWYDWAIVHFEETNPFVENIESFYPSWLLGFMGPRGATITCHNSSAPRGEFFRSDMSWLRADLCANSYLNSTRFSLFGSSHRACAIYPT